MEKLEKAIKQILPGHRNTILRSFRLWNGKKTLVRKGTIAEHMFFINKGFVLVKFKADGREMVRHISSAGEFITAMDSFENGAQSNEQLTAIGDYEIYCIRKSDVRLFRSSIPDFETMWIKGVTNYLVSCQNRIADLLSLDAEAYYKKLLAEKREIFQSVPQYELASYLGIRPQSLSRIRKSIS